MLQRQNVTENFFHGSNWSPVREVEQTKEHMNARGPSGYWIWGA